MTKTLKSRKIRIFINLFAVDVFGLERWYNMVKISWKLSAPPIPGFVHKGSVSNRAKSVNTASTIVAKYSKFKVPTSHRWWRELRKWRTNILSRNSWRSQLTFACIYDHTVCVWIHPDGYIPWWSTFVLVLLPVCKAVHNGGMGLLNLKRNGSREEEPVEADQSLPLDCNNRLL